MKHDVSNTRSSLPSSLSSRGKEGSDTLGGNSLLRKKTAGGSTSPSTGQPDRLQGIKQPQTGSGLPEGRSTGRKVDQSVGKTTGQPKGIARGATGFVKRNRPSHPEHGQEAGQRPDEEKKSLKEPQNGKSKNASSRRAGRHSAPVSGERRNIRKVALQALQKIFDSHLEVQAVLDEIFTSMPISAQDRRFCSEIVYGVLRKSIRLEWFLSRFLKNYDKLPVEMTIALQMACYEIFFMRVPEYATLDSYVRIIKSRFGQTLSKVANGVLRNIQKNVGVFFAEETYEKAFDDSTERLACYYAVPEFIVKLWISFYSYEQTVGYLEGVFGSAASGLRFNKRKSNWQDAYRNLFLLEATKDLVASEYSPSHAGHKKVSHEDHQQLDATINPKGTSSFKADRSSMHSGQSKIATRAEAGLVKLPGLDFAVGVRGRLPDIVHTLVEEGRVSQQSPATLEALFSLGPSTWPGPVWDCCCGRGGKTLALLENGVAVTLASDLSKKRLIGLKLELERLGIDDPIIVCEGDAAHADGFLAGVEGVMHSGCGAFGTVFIDAPCSGFGTLARRPEIRFRRTEQDVHDLVALQRSILDAVSHTVASGGFVVYMTCTLNPEENENQVAAFMHRNSEFTLLKEWQTPSDSAYGEFFYGAVMQKG